MNLEKHAGFTIIEVTLFLGVSGLLFLLIFIGTGSTLRTTRFTDSVRSTQSFFQQQADEVLNGVNSRDASLACSSAGITEGSSQQAGTSGCLLLGKVMHQNGNQIDIYPVVATKVPKLADTGNDQQLIQDADPIIVLSQKTSFSLPWGATIQGGLVKGSLDDYIANTLTILRSPASSQLFYYSSAAGENFFEGTSPVAVTKDNILGILNATPTSYLNKPTTYCITDSSGSPMIAGLTVASDKDSSNNSNGQAAQNAVTTEFDVANKKETCGVL